MTKFSIMRVHSKLRYLRGEGEGVTENQYIEGDCLKSGAWTVCRFKRGLGKKEGNRAYSRNLEQRSILARKGTFL